MFSKEEIERIKRETSLPELAASYGYAVDEKASCRTSLVMRHHGRKIIVATGEDGHGIFFDVHGSASGSVIDFVMWQEGINFGAACKNLSGRLTAPRNSFPAVSKNFPKPAPISHDRAGVVAAWERMKPYRLAYLEERGLFLSTLELFSEHIRTDERGNTCFLHGDENGVSGWEVKNKGFTGFSRGGEKALFMCRIEEAMDTEEQRIVIAESAIDAMSCYQLNPSDGIYVSIAEGMNKTQPELLRRTLAQYPHARIFIATDNDLPTKEKQEPEGEHYYEVISKLCPPTATVIRARPLEPYKDWNDKLTGRTRQPKPGHVQNIIAARNSAKEPERLH
jgi:hypothetical protein